MITTFGDIRSILHQEPSQETWQALCEAIDGYTGSEPLEEVVLPYCVGVLDGWPEEVERAAPYHWGEPLLGSEVPPQLVLCTALNLEWGPPVGPDGARALASSPLLGGLRHLSLKDCDILDEGAQALASSPQLGNLRTLNLMRTSLTAAGVEALAQSPHLVNLRVLRLSDDLGPRAIEALAASRDALGGAAGYTFV